MWTKFITWMKKKSIGRTLVLLVVIKLFVMFGILRVFFFQPALKNMNEAEKAQVVGQELVTKE